MNCSGPQKKGKNSGIDTNLGRTSLVVCPSSGLSTRERQLREPVNPRNLKAYLYEGNRTRDVGLLRRYDIVLTSHSIQVSEHYWAEEYPMKKIGCWQVVVDEAQNILNVDAQQSEAIASLMAKRKWVVIGMPILNGSFDLFSFKAFLRSEPFSVKTYWQSLVHRPLNQRNPKGLSRLQEDDRQSLN